MSYNQLASQQRSVYGLFLLQNCYLVKLQTLGTDISKDLSPYIIAYIIITKSILFADDTNIYLTSEDIRTLQNTSNMFKYINSDSVGGGGINCH